MSTAVDAMRQLKLNACMGCDAALCGAAAACCTPEPIKHEALDASSASSSCSKRSNSSSGTASVCSSGGPDAYPSPATLTSWPSPEGAPHPSDSPDHTSIAQISAADFEAETRELRRRLFADESSSGGGGGGDGKGGRVSSSGSQSSLPPVPGVLLPHVLEQQWQQRSRLGQVAEPLLVENEDRFTMFPIE